MSTPQRRRRDDYIYDRGIANLNGYEPSREAVMEVARNCEDAYVRLNRDITHTDCAQSIAMREMMSLTASTACAKNLAQVCPEAIGGLKGILEEQARVYVDVMRGWRRVGRG